MGGWRRGKEEKRKRGRNDKKKRGLMDRSSKMKVGGWGGEE